MRIVEGCKQHGGGDLKPKYFLHEYFLETQRSKEKKPKEKKGKKKKAEKTKSTASTPQGRRVRSESRVHSAKKES